MCAWSAETWPCGNWWPRGYRCLNSSFGHWRPNMTRQALTEESTPCGASCQCSRASGMKRCGMSTRAKPQGGSRGQILMSCWIRCAGPPRKASPRNRIWSSSREPRAASAWLSTAMNHRWKLSLVGQGWRRTTFTAGESHLHHGCERWTGWSGPTRAIRCCMPHVKC